jgi:hypothetical protein
LGRDPGTSALDPTCGAHEVDNLDVVDAPGVVAPPARGPGFARRFRARDPDGHALTVVEP